MIIITSVGPESALLASRLAWLGLLLRSNSQQASWLVWAQQVLPSFSSTIQVEKMKKRAPPSLWLASLVWFGFLTSEETFLLIFSDCVTRIACSCPDWGQLQAEHLNLKKNPFGHHWASLLKQRFFWQVLIFFPNKNKPNEEKEKSTKMGGPSEGRFVGLARWEQMLNVACLFSSLLSLLLPSWRSFWAAVRREEKRTCDYL